ncbi:MAG: DUF1570 domain-containing protein [Pirellulales bacterium]
MRRWGLAVWLGLLTAGCQIFPAGTPAPGRHSILRDQLVIHSDFSLPERHRLLDELAAQRMLVSQRLKLAPTSQPIDVYLFDTAADYDQFVALRYPEFPRRRAFFVQTDGRLVVYAHWNERVAEDLRHEVCHGYLHAALELIPLWLDEGLAEYFEVPSGGRGLNAPHVRELAAAIREDNWRPDLKRLEAIAPHGSMTQRDYAESWAWVYYLLESDPERSEALHAYLRSLEAGEEPLPLSVALRQHHYQPDETLREFILSLAHGVEDSSAQNQAVQDDAAQLR